jgi:Inhibitor of vertebrate lysozyme (Ivy)
MKKTLRTTFFCCVIVSFLCCTVSVLAAAQPGKGATAKDKKAKTVIEYVAFPEALKKYDAFPWDMPKIAEFNSSYSEALGGGSREDWVRSLTGTGNRNRMVHALKANFLLVSCCKPHACDTSQIVVLFNPAVKRCWALYAHDGAFDYLGNPDEGVKNLLRILLIDEYKDIYAGQ